MANDLTITVGFGADESQLTRVFEGIQNRANKTSLFSGSNLRQAEFALGRITGKANEFQKSLEASNARVLAFGASAGTIFAVRAAFEKLIQSTISVEKSLADINSLLNLSSRDLQTFANNLFNVANKTGTSFDNAAKAATEFSRQGLGVEETLKRTAAALTLSRLSGIGFEEAVSSLTGTLNSFTKEVLSAEDVVNRLAAVDARYAVSAGDLAKALSRVGASANDANVSLNETVALVTAAQQVTARGGSVIGNAFKTIFTRLQRPEVLDALEQAGVSTETLAGKTKPLIDILRNLAGTYDSLASEQKSFVAETVGGVYQINVLKAVMNDLGSGTSIVQGALKVAGDSAGSAEARLKALNNTISSSLLRTMNDLTQASSNVGNALLGSTLRAGHSNLQGLLQSVSNATNPVQAEEGSFGDQAKANVTQGALKGLGNLIKGPGLQAGVFLLLKLFERLEKFVIDSAKDLAGLDKQTKDREAIEKLVAEHLGDQSELYKQIITGEKTVAEAAKEILETVNATNAALRTRQTLSSAIAGVIAPSVSVKTKTSASGHIPNLADPEQQAARQNNYFPGQTVGRTIRNGLKSMDVLANTRETMSTVTGSDGLPYDFINPPQGTAAWHKHRAKSIAATGIDPMSLSRRPMAGGFVPNLALTADQIEPFVRAFFNKPHQIGQVEALMKSVRRKGYLPSDEKGLRHYLGGVMLAKQAFPGVTPTDADKLTSMITGVDIGQLKQEALTAKTTTLNPKDVQAILSRFGGDFPLISAYNSAENLSAFKNYQKDYQIRVGENTFSVPVSILSHSEGGKYFKAIQEKLKFAGKELGVNSPLNLPASTFGAGFGAIFDETLRNFFKERGVDVGGINSPIDVLGYHPDISKFIGTNKPFAGAEIKASATEAGTLPAKIFRMLAGEPNTGTLKGPVSKVPPLRNVGLFNNTQGSVGILDWDEFKKVSRKENDFHSLVYSAIATGKPFKVNYGPMGSGKTTAAKMMADKLGGSFVLNRDDANNKNIDQFILTTTAVSEDSLQKGVYGLAFGASSHIESFSAGPRGNKSELDVLRERIAERGRDNESPDVLINENKLSRYNQAFEYLRNTFGPLGRYKHTTTAGGFVPNLAFEEIMGSGGLRGKYGSFTIKGGEDTLHEGKFWINWLEKTGKGYDTFEDHIPAFKSDLAERGLNKVDFFADDYDGRREVRQRLFKRLVKKHSMAEGFAPSGFFTAQGSKYHLNELGQTSRLKLSEGRGQGTQYPFYPAAYVHEKASEEIMNALNSGGRLNMFEITEKGYEQIRPGSKDSLLKRKIGLGVMDRKTGKFMVGGPAHSEPQVGRVPVEMHYEDDIKTYHIGHPITQMFAGGFFPAIKDALSRENKATGGRAILDSHPSLRTSQNPYGLAAIDKRQGSAANAIKQHLMFQSMDEVKRASTSASGHVPNLAVQDSIGNSVILGLLTYGNQVFSSGTKLQQLADKWPKLAARVSSETDIQISKQRALVTSFDNLRNELLTGSVKSGAFEGKSFQGTPAGAKKLEDEFKDLIAGHRASLKKYDDATSESASRISRTGLRTSLVASLGGGIASQVAGRFNPTAGAAVDVFSTSVTNAGQALLAFPNRIGKSIGAGFIASGLLGTLDTLSKKLETSRKYYELEQSASQKLIARVDALSVTVNNLDSLMNDASVSAGTLTRENRRYVETLNQIRQTPDGKGKAIATAIETAPDNRSRLRLLDEFKQSESLRLEQLANVQSIKELASGRSFDLGNFHKSSGTFSFSNPFDKEPLQQTVLATASTAISGFTTEFKDKLLASVDSLTDFNAAIENGDKGFKDLLDTVEKTGTKQDRGIIVQQVRSLLAEQKLQSNPDIAKARADLLSRNEQRQQRLDNVIRQEQATRRLFVNQGALQAGNTLDVRNVTNAQTFSRANLDVARRQAASGLFQSQFGEQTNRSFSTATELRRIEAERTNRVSSVNTQASRNIVDQLTQNFDENIKNISSLKDVGKNEFSTSISEFKVNFISALNKGISTVVAEGNLDRFKKNGQFDFGKLEDAITRRTNASPDLQRQIQGYLQNNRSVELLKTIEGANNELVTINQEALTEAEKQTIALEGFRKEADFKQLSSFLGGVHNLLDRGSRRSLERDAIRGATLLRNGTTPEARAFGGATLLNFFKSQNIPLDLSGKSPLSKLMKEAFEVAGKGLADVQKGSIGRILGSVGRLTGDQTVNQGLKAYGNVDFNKTALAALQAEFRPENKQILNGSNQFGADSLVKFNTELNDSIKSVKDFAKALETTKNDLITAVHRRDNVRTQVSKEGNLDAEKFNQFLKKFEDIIKAPELQRKTNVYGNVPGNVGAITTAITAGFQYYQYRQLGALIKQTPQGKVEVPQQLRPIQPPANSGVTYRDERGVIRSIPSKEFTTSTPENFKPRRPVLRSYQDVNGKFVSADEFGQSVPENLKGFTRPASPAAPVPYVPGRVGRGFANVGGGAGALAFAYGGQQLAQHIQNPYLSGAVSVGSIVGAPFAGAGIQKGILGALPLLRAGGFGLGAGGGALSLSGLGAAGTLGVGALAAGTAIGGYKLGSFAYNRLSGIHGVEGELGNGGSAATENIRKIIKQMVQKGKSEQEIESFVNQQIETTQGQINTAEKGSNGFQRVLGAGGSGLGGVDAALKQTLEEIKNIKTNIGAFKENFDANKQQTAFQDNFIKALDKLSSNTGGAVSSAIKVDISVKDADKIPDFLASKLIEPLKKQFADLQSQVNGLQQHLNIPPNPAKIG